jgi:hypothetical protein
MGISGWLLGISIIAAVGVVTIARSLSKQHIFKGRKPVSVAEMYQQEVARVGVSYQIFEKVLHMIGQAYDIDPRMLRPFDKLKVLYDLDSWSLGKGTEILNGRVASDFGISEFKGEPETIIDLVVEIENQVGALKK